MTKTACQESESSKKQLGNHITLGKYPLSTCNLPKFCRWGGGVPYRWSLSWLTGMDKDIVYAKHRVNTVAAGRRNQFSPSCSTGLLALLVFVLKAILVKIDHNLRGLEG